MHRFAPPDAAANLYAALRERATSAEPHLSPRHPRPTARRPILPAVPAPAMAATRPLRPLARLFMPSSHLPSSSHFPSFSSSGRRHSTTGSTVDASELQHFAQLASSWWDPHGSSRLLHLMNPLRLRFLQSCLLRSPPYSSTASARLERGADPIATVTGKDNARRMRYLDVGCGGGILAESLARLPSTADVLAVDPSPEVLAVARAHARRDPVLRGRLRYENTTVDALGAQHGVEAPGQFDVVRSSRGTVRG